MQKKSYLLQFFSPFCCVASIIIRLALASPARMTIGKYLRCRLVFCC